MAVRGTSPDPAEDTVAGTLTRVTPFAMWIVSQTSHPRDVISHASVSLCQDPSKLRIFLKKQTLHETTDVAHLLCRCARLEGLELYSSLCLDLLVQHCTRDRGSPANVSRHEPAELLDYLQKGTQMSVSLGSFGAGAAWLLQTLVHIYSCSDL